MEIDFDTFLTWAENHFEDISTSFTEIKVNSIFTDDTKRHLWCNPSKNAYHCWKTDKSGSLPQLVSLVEKCSYQEAVKILRPDEIRMLERKALQYLKEKREQSIFGKKALEKKNLDNIELPPNSFLISDLPEESRYRIIPQNYMKSRHLSIDGLYFCTSGRYENRIIIPYYSQDGSLIYWNSRDITDKSPLGRYRGPEDEKVVGKSDVLWMKYFPEKGSKIYLTEGEFDAMSLYECGFIAAALGGKNFNEKQIELLHDKNYELFKSYKICISFDNDKSGKEALNKVGANLISIGQEVSYVRPPLDFKDWNAMLINLGKDVIRLYIEKNEQPFTKITDLLHFG